MVMKDDDKSGSAISAMIPRINQEELPSYSTERFFMLSEMEQHAHSIKYLSEELVDDNDNDNDNDDAEHEEQTLATKEEAESIVTTNDDFIIINNNGAKKELESSNNNESNNNNNYASCHAPYIIVYILWSPDMTSCVETFTEKVIIESINKLQRIVPVQKNNAVEIDDDEASSLLPTNNNTTQENTESSSNSSIMHRHHVYLVVDRVAIPPKFNDNDMSIDKNDDDDDDNVNERLQNAAKKLAEIGTNIKHDFQKQTKLSHELINHVASHSSLRHIIEGMMIGVSNHERAAPGLDGCLKAIMHGSRDRRRHYNNTSLKKNIAKLSLSSLSLRNKQHDNDPATTHYFDDRFKRSSIGMMATISQDMLGIDIEAETDAVTDVYQVRINAEWNGKGNILHFAARAQAYWGKSKHLAPIPTTSLEEEDVEESKNKKKSSHHRNNKDSSRIINIILIFCMLLYLWTKIPSSANNILDETTSTKETSNNDRHTDL